MNNQVVTRNSKSPLTQKIAKYLQKDFQHDLIAGVIVGIIAIPLAIAFAIASGAKAEQGIYTSIIAGLVMGALSGSKFQISGPTGAFVVILLGVVNKFGLDGLMIAGFLAGLILLLMGLFRFGSIIKYIPYPVTVGFTSGIGVIIFSGQIKDLLGLSFEHRPNGFLETMQAVFSALGNGINISSIIIATVSLAAFILWKKFNKTIPPAPIALVAGIITSLIINFGLKGLLPSPALVGHIPAGLPQFQMLNFSWDTIQLLIPSAFTIAMLGAIESLLSAVVADGMTGSKHNSNKELISQGVGNLILPFFGGIPATGAIARTAANIKNGGKTQMSAVIHGLTLLIILLVAAPLAAYIPMAALAAILVMVAYNMAEIPHFIHLLRAPKTDALVLLSTFFLTVFLDLTVAVGMGIVLAALLFIGRVSQLSVSRIFEDPEGKGSEGSERLHESIRDLPEIQLYEFAGPLFFGVASQLESLMQHCQGEIVIFRMKHVHHIDASAAHTLEVIVDRVLNMGGKVYLATLHPEVKKCLIKTGVVKKIGGEHFLPDSATEAISRAKQDLKNRS